MTTKQQHAGKWWIVVICLAIAAISGGALWYMLHVMLTPPVGFSAPPNPSIAGIIQAAIAAFMTGGFTLAGLLTFIANIWHQYHPGTPSDPANPTLSSVEQDLLIAFPAWMADRTDQSKSRRMWFDFCELVIAADPDPETRAWMHAGTQILLKKFFPVPSPNDPSVKS